MIKYKIVLFNQTIEFASQELALQYKQDNNLDVEIESFEDQISTPSLVPQIVTPRQIRVALIMSGINLQSIEDTIDSLPEPDRSIVRVTWEYSVEFQRFNPFVSSMAPLLNLTESQIDQLFILADTL